MRALLGRHEPRIALPAFATVRQRAERRAFSFLAPLAAGAAAVVIAAALATWFGSGGSLAPSTPPPTGTPAASSQGSPGVCPASASALVGPRASGRWLVTSLERVATSDPQTNEMRWFVRFSLPGGAPAAATAQRLSHRSVCRPLRMNTAPFVSAIRPPRE